MKRAKFESSTEDMVQAIKTFMECSMISNRHNYKEISARFRRLDLELEAMLDRPYDRGLFEQIVEPLRTLWITLLELGQSRRWHVVSTNTHIARYPDSDLEVTDSLDDVVEGIDHWQNYFPNNPMVVSWYLGLVERHAARFLATENIKIVDQLMKILSWIRFSLRKYLEDEMLAKKLWEVWIKCMQRFCKQNADFRDLHRAVRIYDKVQDEYCVDNARIFYETLRDEGISDDVVCLGLHRATMTLRNRTIGTPVKVESSLTKTSVDTTKVTTTDGSQTVNETSIDLGGDNKASITSNMRTAELVSRLAKQGNKLHPHYWAPYVHFGL